MRKTAPKKYPCKDMYCKILEGLIKEEVWAEWQFHPTRRWRFDYAITKYRIAIEIDGGVFTNGRHSGGVGQLKDFEKMNAAVVCGWVVLHYTPEQRQHWQTIQEISSVIERRKVELNL